MTRFAEQAAPLSLTVSSHRQQSVNLERRFGVESEHLSRAESLEHDGNRTTKQASKQNLQTSEREEEKCERQLLRVNSHQGNLQEPLLQERKRLPSHQLLDGNLLTKEVPHVDLTKSRKVEIDDERFDLDNLDRHSRHSSNNSRKKDDELSAHHASATKKISIRAANVDIDMDGESLPIFLSLNKQHSVNVGGAESDSEATDGYFSDTGSCLGGATIAEGTKHRQNYKDIDDISEHSSDAEETDSEDDLPDKNKTEKRLKKKAKDLDGTRKKKAKEGQQVKDAGKDRKKKDKVEPTKVEVKGKKVDEKVNKDKKDKK